MSSSSSTSSFSSSSSRSCTFSWTLSRYSRNASRIVRSSPMSALIFCVCQKGDRLPALNRASSSALLAALITYDQDVMPLLSLLNSNRYANSFIDEVKSFSFLDDRSGPSSSGVHWRRGPPLLLYTVDETMVEVDSSHFVVVPSLALQTESAVDVAACGTLLSSYSSGGGGLGASCACQSSGRFISSNMTDRSLQRHLRNKASSRSLIACEREQNTRSPVKSVSYQPRRCKYKSSDVASTMTRTPLKGSSR
mmetsp:Transcript_2205/g.2992  ORF Transcript_2205/g.2992 Transcript_2205/m.2992 type:complete len:251 (-) Transcript_2205:123-875(-)